MKLADGLFIITPYYTIAVRRDDRSLSPALPREGGRKYKIMK